MTQSEFIKELDHKNIRFTNKLTKWGSGYWMIDGKKYRMADHRKPSDHFTNYVYGENDFSNFNEMLNKVIENVKSENEVRHLTYEQRDMLGYGTYLLENNPVEFKNWIKYHAEFNELNK